VHQPHALRRPCFLPPLQVWGPQHFFIRVDSHTHFGNGKHAPTPLVSCISRVSQRTPRIISGKRNVEPQSQATRSKHVILGRTTHDSTERRLIVSIDSCSLLLTNIQGNSPQITRRRSEGAYLHDESVTCRQSSSGPQTQQNFSCKDLPRNHTNNLTRFRQATMLVPANLEPSQCWLHDRP
jgi:hypothetical protein